MRLLFISMLSVAAHILAASPVCLAQNYDVTIIADGKPINLSQGIPVTTKVLELAGQLTPKSLQQHSQLKPTVLINKATLNLIRNLRRVGFINWPADGSIAGLFKEAKVGDQSLIQFADVMLQTKQGVTQRIDDSKILQVTVRE